MSPLKFLVWAACVQDPAPPHHADILVYGGTASGVISAVAAAREGKTVLLLEPGRHVGGMVSGGLGATDTGRRETIGGYSREFFLRVQDYYLQKYGEGSPQVLDCSNGFHFEPHVAEEIFRAMLREEKIDPLFNRRLTRVTKVGPRIQSITAHTGESFSAAIFIDASYEGDLMAQSGVTHTVGRESREEFGESIGGVQAHSPSHQWPFAVKAVDDQNSPLPCVSGEPPGPTGSGDQKIQAYNFRLCMTNRPENLVAWPRPEGYDSKRYELLARLLAQDPHTSMRQLMNPVRMPNDKTDTNNNGPFSTDHIGANWKYPEGDEETRLKIWRDHISYVQGFFYFLASDPRVPEPLQKEIRMWGLAKDEFLDTDHWPHQLYVREARRMIGEYRMTQADIQQHRTKEDSVGLGSYNTDSHHVQRLIVDGNALNEGDFQVPVKPYAIPYACLLPKIAECENLLVPICCSATHVAYGTIRMEPVYMILGQASGVAASLAIEAKTAVQRVPIVKLQSKLLLQKAKLTFGQ